MSDFDSGAIRALVFDVFGTVVDWRASIVREGQALSATKGLRVDWPAFADAWRAGYVPAMQRAMASRPDGESAWASIDVLHREILESLLARFGLDGLNEAERVHLNRVWHRLDPWPDSVRGLRRLKSHFVISTLSNGNIALLVDMAKHARLPWDCVLSGELVRRYKPDPEVYLSPVEFFDLTPPEVMMVAAHQTDLQGPKRLGLRTAYVHRPYEGGSSGTPQMPVAGTFDLIARDLREVATLLGT